MGVKYECREIGEGDWRGCTEDEYRRYSGYPEMDTRVVGRFSSGSGQPHNLPKIIGRFEPIGEEVGRPRVGFDVVTKEDWVDPKSGRPGFKGVSLYECYPIEYSVISEFWRWAPDWKTQECRACGELLEFCACPGPTDKENV